ncbi:MAG: hypothetical protein MRY83_02590 [Flavobacteriales bacterium]|nr:hypothetical protein [Flavobacteriales bacterium]
MKLKQDLPLSHEEHAYSTFIINEGENGIIYGGAILFKQPINTLPTQLRTFLSACVLNKKDVWVCTLALCFENINDSSVNKDKFNFSQAFYNGLLQKLNEFGKKKSINFLCLTLNPFECLRIKDKKVWSCIVEVGSKKNLNSLFYGILPLPYQKHKITTETQKSKTLLNAYIKPLQTLFNKSRRSLT